MQYENIVEFEVLGDYILFSDPITRVGGEKFIYQVPTYEALKGVLQSVFRKPTLTWVIDSVRVMNQIQTETKGIRSIKYQHGPSETGNDLSYYTYLKDCRYQVWVHPIWNENRPELQGDRSENEHHNIAKRMIERGDRRDISLGTRECQADVHPCIFGAGTGFYDNTLQLDFGMMHHGTTYTDEAYSEETKRVLTVWLWCAMMKQGVIDFLPSQECLHRPVREMETKPFGAEKNNFASIGFEAI